MKKFYRAIFFTKVPLGGYYKYSDIFQIFPFNTEGMPKSILQTHYPNIIEFWIKETDIEKVQMEFGEINLRTPEFEGVNQMIDEMAFMLRKQDELLSLLSLFTNNLFFRYKSVEGFWGLKFPITEETPDNLHSSDWYIKMYHFKELPKNMQISKFTEMNIGCIEKKTHKDYYTQYPNIDLDNKLNVVLPDTIDSIFDAYYGLESAKALGVCNSIIHSISAIELHDTKKTLSLLSSFTAIETMVNLEYEGQKIEKCSECGQPKFSVSKKFRDYLLKYIGNSSENEKVFKYYYSLRSKIVHKGDLLKTEQLFPNISRDVKDKEFTTRVEILQITRLSIINWLLKN